MAVQHAFGVTPGAGPERMQEGDRMRTSRLENEVAGLHILLADKEAEIQRLSAEHVGAEKVAFAVQSSRVSLRNKTVVQAETMNADYDRIAELQAEADEYNKKSIEQQSQILKLQREQDVDRISLQEREQQVVAKDTENAKLLATIDQMREDVHNEKAASEILKSHLDDAYASFNREQAARENAETALSEAQTLQRDTQRQIDDLFKQLAESQDASKHLHEQLEAYGELERENANLENDVEIMRAERADRDRIITVKDERINQLEIQYQKERQRNLHAADAADAAAATSPIDAPPQPFNAIVDTLEDELAAASDYGESVYEPLELSHVTEIVHVTPIEPASPPALVVHVREVASITPIAATVPTFTVNMREATSIAPVAAIVPTLTEQVREAASVTPIAPTKPVFTVHVNEAAGVTPTAASIKPLTVNVSEATSITPTAAIIPALAVHVHEATSVAPIAPANPALIVQVNEAASVVPSAPTNPAFTVHVREATSVAPTAPENPTLTVHVDEAASTSPIERQFAHTTSSTQTDSPELTTKMLHHATHSITPTARKEILSSTSYTQTDTPRAEQSTASAQTDVPMLTAGIINTASVDIAPVEAEKTELYLSSTSGTQTAILTPAIKVAPVLVTHEERPRKEYMQKRSIASTAAQTIETKKVIDPAPPLVLALPPKNISLFQTILPLLATILAVFCFKFYMELQAWKNANGIGFGNGYGNVYGHSGAFGNGRYLFGVIPLAMDVGNSWWSEQVARTMSIFITRVEGWAGLTPKPLY